MAAPTSPKRLPKRQVAEGQQSRWVQVTSTRPKLPVLQEAKREINFNSAAPACRHREIKVTGQGPWGGDNLPPGSNYSHGREGGREAGRQGGGPARASSDALHPKKQDALPQPQPGPSYCPYQAVTRSQIFLFIICLHPQNVGPPTAVSPGPRTVPKHRAGARKCLLNE